MMIGRVANGIFSADSTMWPYRWFPNSVEELAAGDPLWKIGAEKVLVVVAFHIRQITVQSDRR